MSQTNTTPLDFGKPADLDASLSDRIRGLQGSKILQIAADIRQLRADGHDICNLTVGDFDPKQFPIPEALGARIEESLRAGQTNYPPSDGVPELRQAVTRFAARDWGVEYPVESVLISSGARPTIFAAYEAVVNPGDRVVYPVPSWNNHYYTYLSQAEDVAIPTTAETQFMPTVDDLRPHLGTARMICLNTPSNPTGTVMSPDMIRDIAAAVVEENLRRRKAGERALFLLMDIVYSSLVFGDARHVHPVHAVPESAPWVISVDGVSKGFAGTGLRVGWVVANPALVKRLKALIGHVGAWAPRPMQMGVAAFLDDEDAIASYREVMRGRVRERLDALHAGFETLRRDGYPVHCIEPQGAMFLSLHLDWMGRSIDGQPIDSSDGIRKLLLDHAGMGVVPFQAFGLEGENGWCRISVGAINRDDIGRMMPRLRALMDRLD